MRYHIASLAIAALTATGAMAGEYQTGMQTLSVEDTQGGRDTDGFVWYPTRASDGTTMAHGNAVWESISVIPNASPAEGTRPLVVLSHGMFGNARNQAWLAEALTKEGYVVAAIDHPGTTTFNRDPDRRRALWERPRDISRTIDQLLASDFGSLIDPDRIFMAGHSLGGFTGVALAGGRYDPDRVEADCAAGKDDLICGIFNSWEIAKTEEDRIAMVQDLSDPRIAGFAIFDLGGTQTFAPETISAIDRPMLIVGASAGNSDIDIDRESRALAEAVGGQVLYMEPEGLAHFDFLGVCTENALEILKEEAPDDLFVCENGTEARRAQHAAVAGDVLSFFGGIAAD